MRISRLLGPAILALASIARAQAPAAGPLALLLPISTHAIGLGNAWVAGRDDYSVFYNPAQIYPTNGIGGSFARYGSNATLGALTGAVSVGPVTYGWGVELVQFRARASAMVPFVPAELIQYGTRQALSFAAVAGAGFVYRGFRTGLGVKYTEDRVDGIVGSASSTPIEHGLFLGDLGISHPLLSGTAAVAVQNIGDRGKYPVPLVTTLGWVRQWQAGQLDLAVAGQVSERQSWMGGGGGAEIGYGWIEGWSAALRAGARRPETNGQKPVSIGGTLNADRLVVDYAIEFFDSGRYAHHISVRWR